MLVFEALLLIVAVAISLKIWQFLKKYYKDRKLLQSIPAPPEHFLFGHSYIIASNPNGMFLTHREYAKKYYPIYRLSLLDANSVHFLDPDDIKLILTSTKHLSKTNNYDHLRNWLGTGLLTSTGAKWHKRRKILTPAFHFTILQDYLSTFNNKTIKLVEEMDEKCCSGGIIDVVPPITNFTLQTIVETAAGLSQIDEKSEEDYNGAFHEIGQVILRRWHTPWYRIGTIYNLSSLAKKEEAVIKRLHDFSNSIIRRRENEITGSTNSLGTSSTKKHMAMLDLLLLAKNEGAEIHYEGIREEVDTFVFEGHDTTAMAISFLFLILANHQDIQSKVLEEILSVLGASKLPSYDDLQKLKYAERCIKETLRLFPSVPLISRRAGEEFITKTGHTIPKGTALGIHIFNLHRNEEVYPESEKFDPDRFLPENVAGRHPFAYIPFSAGPRNCIGQKFAVLELKSVLCGVLRRFKLEKVDDMKGFGLTSDFVLRPLNGVKVKILPRCLDEL